MKTIIIILLFSSLCFAEQIDKVKIVKELNKQYAQGNYKEAMKSLDVLIEAETNRKALQALFNMREICFVLSVCQMQMEEATKIIMRKNNDYNKYKAYMLRAECRLKFGNYQGALFDYTFASKIVQSKEAFDGIGLSYLKLMDIVNACQAFKKGSIKNFNDFCK